MRRPDRESIDGILCELVAMQSTNASMQKDQFHSFAGAWQYRDVYQAVQRYLPPAASVLDWGCGSGHFSFGLNRLGYAVTAYSFDGAVSEDLIAGARLVRGTGSDPIGIPFEDGEFDAVMSIGVLEHVRDSGGNEPGSLREIGRVLKADGVFVCAHLPNRFSLIEAAARLFPNKHHHRNRYTATTIRAMLAASGFAPISIQRYGALPRNSFRRAPEAVRTSLGSARGWHALDRALAFPLRAVTQNYLFVAKKESDTTSV